MASTSTSRSPVKEIKRVHHHDNRRERSGDRVRIPSNRNSNHFDDSEERLARFTEYRGEGVDEVDDASSRRKSALIYGTSRSSREDVSGRERGQSLPPGANIDSIRDFYKSSQYKSMYALPPSPSRPAPVLERAPSSSTLTRPARSNRPPTRVAVSESEFHDSNHRQLMNAPQPPARRPSTKRQAPSPPGRIVGVRRVVSSDREDKVRLEPVRRVASSDRGLQRPPQRRPVGRRTSMGDALDSSYSESEGLNGDVVSAT